MAQLKDDCFAFEGQLTRLDEAIARLDDFIEPVVAREKIVLKDALGRILGEDVTAQHNIPPFNNSAVDGYAVYFDDIAENRQTSLRVVGTAAAGRPYGRSQNRGEAIRIFTGAAMPLGSDTGFPDTVMMQEDCEREIDFVTFGPGIKRGANRRLAGEDVMAGSIILQNGCRLRPQEIGLAAAVGRNSLTVQAPLKVAVFSTGDEIREPGTTREADSIFDSNRFTLTALLRGLGCVVEDLGILPDEPSIITEALCNAAEKYQLIMTSGGVSTGEEDHVRTAVEANGSLYFWRLAIKPGRPVALGRVKNTVFIGLPGNPVAVMVTFLRVARPLILKLSGSREQSPRSFKVLAGFNYQKKPQRREFVRTRLQTDSKGRHVAHKYKSDGAGILSSMVFADGLVEIPEDITNINEGDVVDYLPFNEVGL